MPGDSGVTAVNTRVHSTLPTSHTRLRAHWAPGIPHALCFGGGSSFKSSGASRREAVDACVDLSWLFDFDREFACDRASLASLEGSYHFDGTWN
jgi:hypothetical protein